MELGSNALSALVKGGNATLDAELLRLAGRQPEDAKNRDANRTASAQIPDRVLAEEIIEGYVDESDVRRDYTDLVAAPYIRWRACANCNPPPYSRQRTCGEIDQEVLALKEEVFRHKQRIGALEGKVQILMECAFQGG